MKIPKKIKLAIKDASILFSMAIQNSNLVRDYLEKQNLSNDYVLDQYIDAVEYGLNKGNDFIEFLKNQTKKELQNHGKK